MLLALFALACAPDASHPTRHPAQTEETDDSGTAETGRARWDFLVYMNGDNDLEEYVAHDLNELEIVGSTEGVNVLVQADRIDGYATDDGDWTGTRRYYIDPDDDPHTVNSSVLEDLGELDMGDPQTLADFLLWANEGWPADHVAVILWDHGDGWAFTGPDPRGAVSWDDSSGNDISVAEGELAAALQPLVDERGAHIDLLGFDACNMASWEVADAMSGLADYLVGSEATVGGAGLQYAPALRLLRDADDDSPRALADDMASSAVKQGGEWTYSATDLSQVAALSASIDALAGYLLDQPDGVSTFESARDGADAVDRDYPDWYLDLGSLADGFSASGDADLATLGAAVRQANDAAMVGDYANEPLTFAGGLTVHTDTSEEWADYLELYHVGAGATWAQRTRWDDLLLAAAGGL